MTDPQDVIAAADQEKGKAMETLAEADGVLQQLERRRGPDRRKRRKKRPLRRVACLKCGYLESKILDPRPIIGDMEGSTYWRVRRCRRCGALYSTEEVPREILPLSKTA